VEETLKSAHFDEAGGFVLKPFGFVCRQSLTLTPNGELVSGNSNESKLECTPSKPGCYCCCLPSFLSLQNLSLKQSQEEVLSFTFRPELWWTFCRRKIKKVHIFAPQLGNSIGSVSYGKAFGGKGVIVDRISRSLFLIVKMKSTYNSNNVELPRMMIKDLEGNRMAIAKATECVVKNVIETRYTKFVMTFSPLAQSEMASAKAVMTVAFAMWAMTRREGAYRRYLAFVLPLLFLIIIWKTTKIIINIL